MKAYLQKYNNEWFDDFVYSAKQPLLDRGFTIITFDETTLPNLIFDKDDIIVGSVESTKAFFNAVNIETPKYIGYPKSLDSFYGRTIKRTRFGKITLDDLPIFIKPVYDVKLFTGFVLEKSTTLHNIGMYYSNVNPNTAVYTSEPINIVSEYRCFVHKNELVGIKHYSGDFNIFPDISEIKSMIQKYRDESPVSYTLDIGIVSNTVTSTYLHQLDETCTVGRKKTETSFKTILIEINDFWAIGGYGLDGKTYVRMLIDRFQEIKNNQ
jgi:hypothetical protein